MRFYHSWSTFKAEYFSFGHKLQLIRTRMYVGLNPLEFALVLDLSLNLHVDYICAIANARLHRNFHLFLVFAKLVQKVFRCSHKQSTKLALDNGGNILGLSALSILLLNFSYLDANLPDGQAVPQLMKCL